MNSARIVITGGSGFLGRSLGAFLAARGYQIVLVSRHQPRTSGPWSHAVWDGQTLGPWADYIDGCAGVVNLAGRSVNCPKTPEHCDEILRSRVDATLVRGQAVRAAANPPQVWVQMSTAHIYGDPPLVRVTEDSEFGYGLAPFVGRSWEGAFERMATAGIRKVVLRTSFVLGRREGALRRLERIARWGLGGKVGHGTLAGAPGRPARFPRQPAHSNVCPNMSRFPSGSSTVISRSPQGRLIGSPCTSAPFSTSSTKSASTSRT